MNVTEVSLRHMRKEIITNKFAANLSWIPNMKTLTIADNDLKTFADVNSRFCSFSQSLIGQQHTEDFSCEWRQHQVSVHHR